MFRSAAYKSLVLAFCCLAMALVAASQTPQPLPAAYNSNAFINYVRTWQPAKPITDAAQVPLQPVGDVQEATAYVDGLGRPIQTVSRQSSPLGKDLVAYTVLDEYGKETIKYLPYTSTASDGYFKTNPFVEQQSFMQARYGSQGENFFYGQVVSEPSPLSRPLKQMAPGNSWTGAERGVSRAYMHNDVAETAVKMWKVESTPGSLPYATGIYPSRELTRTATYDEHNNLVFEYVDKEGRIVLKSVYNNPEWMLTFYVYDDLGQLRYVIPPRATEFIMANNWVPTQTILDELCFRHEYDHRGRMIEKKVPGTAVVYMVYDPWDRLLLTQDGNQRPNYEYLVYKYDALNRQVITGIYTYYGTIEQARQTALTYAPYRYEEPVSTGPGYTSRCWPEINYITLTETYYDGYNNLPVNLSASLVNSGYGNYIHSSYNTAPLYAQPLTASSATRGMVTMSRVKMLGGSGDMLASVNVYDDKGRVIQVQNFNQTGGVDVVTNQYDFSGKLLVSHSMQQKAGTDLFTVHVATRNNYDAQGRLVSLEKNLDNTGWKLLSELGYDEQSQVKTKKLGRKKDIYGNYTSTPLEEQTYDYNIRSWMLGINRDYAKEKQNTDRYFGFDLAYDKQDIKPSSGSPIGTYASGQHNGNIAGQVWKTKGDNEIRKYAYSYDGSNRLTAAAFEQNTGGSAWSSTTVNFSVDNLTYDVNGNILTMRQKGLKLSGSSVIDDLSYGYYPYTNKLAKVTDAQSDPNTKLGDFKDGTNQWDDYGYDVNGNMVADLNKGMGSTTGLDMTSGAAITYNHLNLPKLITVSGKGTIEYVYDASGNKLKKIVTDQTVSPAKVTTTLYISGAVYENDVLQFISHEEGRIRHVAATGATPARFEYDYFLKDHLGNIRMVLTEEQKQDIYPAATLEGSITMDGSPNAVFKEKDYYSIDAANIVDKSTVTGITNYPNKNQLDNPNPNSQQNADSEKLYKLTATSSGGKTGLGITLKVMGGDRIDIFAKSYWIQQNSGGSNYKVPVLDIFTGLLASPSGGASGKATPTQLNGNSGLNSLVDNFLDDPDRNDNGISTTPKAYINWILFDENFRMVEASSGFDRVGSVGTVADHAKYSIEMQKSGYLYVYTSNESPVNVYFDNLQVVHTRDHILEETHYYPFGLTMHGISSNAAGFLENRKKFNQGTEINRNFDINWYETNFRSLDPQLGRFWQMDPLAASSHHLTPYHYASNNPVLRNDPLGLKDSTTASGEHVLGMVIHKDIAIQHIKIPNGFWAKQNLYYDIMDQLNSRNATIDQIKQPSLRAMMHRFDAITKHRNRVSEMTHASDPYIWGILGSPIVALFGAEVAVPLLYQGGQWLVRVGTQYIPFDKISALYKDASLEIWLHGNKLLNGLRSEALAAMAAILYKNNPAQWDKTMKQSGEFKDMIGPIIKWLEKQGSKADGGKIPNLRTDPSMIDF